MNVIGNGVGNGSGWSDMAFKVLFRGQLGAQSDDLVLQGSTYVGDMFMAGAQVGNSYIPPGNQFNPEGGNNYNESDRESNDGHFVEDRFVYSFPRDTADFLGKRICTATGWWAAGRDIVYVDGRPYIRGFEPRRGRLAVDEAPL
jgi:hypothetical protein